MIGTWILVGSLLAFNAWVILTSPYRDQFAAKLAWIVPLTLGVFLAGFLTTRLLSRLGRTGATGVMTAPLFSRRVLIVLATTVAFVLVVTHSLAGVWNVWSGEALYYLALVGCGVALARWCRAATHVPVLVAALTILALSIVSAIYFLRDPDVDFEYGPEKVLFALWNHAAMINMLPLDGTVTWFAWRLAGQLSPSAE